MATYRPNVAAILRKPKNGKILIGHRADHRGSWQFPQGGVDKGEDLIAALEQRFMETGSPRDLTLVFAAAPGDGAYRGANRLAHRGL
ncbi:MAG: NUDIX domain-containing protein, partial [Verrucomicrobiota bacterium]